MNKTTNKPVKVTTKANGPIIIDGSFTWVDEDGHERTADRLVLCRCGASGKMPYCDASHNRIGFCSQ